MQARKILICDDKEENLYSLERILNEVDNVEIIQTTKPEEALRLCLYHDFSLALIDVQMPGMDGYELAEFLRNNERTQELPIIFISALSVEDFHIEKGYAAGATDYIVKPVHAEILVAKVHVFLKLADSKRNLEQMIEERTRRLAESEARFRGTFEHAEIGIAHIGMDGSFLEVNPHLSRMLGYSREELKQKTFQDITHPDDLKGDIELFEKVTRDEIPTYTVEKRYFHKDGSVIWILLTAAVQRDSQGKIIYCISLIKDIGMEKESALAMKRAKEEAEASNAAKSQFLANMSHELRTPLNPILGLSDLILDGVDDTESILQFVRIINTAGNHMLSLVNNVLDFSRLNSGKIEKKMEWINVHNLLSEVAVLLKPSAGNKDLEMIVALDTLKSYTLRSDPTFIRQICINLLANAIKFTNSGSVALNACFQPGIESTGKLVISVTDTGIGITDEDRDRIWEAFERSDNSLSSNKTGTGLGLSISRLQIEQLEGEIHLDSEPGKGSTFTVQLPVEFRKVTCEDTAEHPAPPEDSPGPGTKARILVVEDDQSNQLVIHSMLRKLNCQPSVSGSGKEALEVLDKETFDLVLMDLKMPDMDGYETTERIMKKYSGHPPFPIVALTANVTDDAREKCLAAGMKDFLTKPVDLVRLRELITALQTSLQT